MAPNLQKQQQINPKQYFVDWPKDVANSIKQDNALNGQYYSPSDFTADNVVGWDGRDELWFNKSTGVSFVRPSMDKQLVYEIFKTADEHSDQLKGGHPMVTAWVGDGSFSYMSKHLADWLPIHPGTKQFFTEKGHDL